VSVSVPPPEGRVLLGPFLTEREFEQRVHAPRGSVRAHEFLLRIAGLLSLEPAYPAFQLDGDVVRSDVVWLATLLKRRMSDIEACDWLVRHHRALGGLTPLSWLDHGLPIEEAVQAIG
jgi:hypothetical protein